MYADILILRRLASGPTYGYEIKKHVARVAGLKGINNNVLYPALRRFESEGVIERAGQVAEPGARRPPRTVYRITELGRDLLQALQRDADPDVLADDAEFQVRVSFFDELGPADRLAILAARREYVTGQLKLLQSLRAEAGPGYPWGLKVIDFNIGAFRAEQAWIDQLAEDAQAGRP